MPDDLRRGELPDLASGLANEDVSIGAHSPPPDGGSSDHPIHDEDLDDIEPETYETLVDDIEQAAVFLCSDAASFINGAILVVDGGQWLNTKMVG